MQPQSITSRTNLDTNRQLMTNRVAPIIRNNLVQNQDEVVYQAEEQQVDVQGNTFIKVHIISIYFYHLIVNSELILLTLTIIYDLNTVYIYLSIFLLNILRILNNIRKQYENQFKNKPKLMFEVIEGIFLTIFIGLFLDQQEILIQRYSLKIFIAILFIYYIQTIIYIFQKSSDQKQYISNWLDIIVKFFMYNQILMFLLKKLNLVNLLYKDCFWPYWIIFSIGIGINFGLFIVLIGKLYQRLILKIKVTIYESQHNYQQKGLYGQTQQQMDSFQILFQQQFQLYILLTIITLLKIKKKIKKKKKLLLQIFHQPHFIILQFPVRYIQFYQRYLQQYRIKTQFSLFIKFQEMIKIAKTFHNQIYLKLILLIKKRKIEYLKRQKTQNYLQEQFKKQEDLNESISKLRRSSIVSQSNQKVVPKLNLNKNISQNKTEIKLEVIDPDKNPASPPHYQNTSLNNIQNSRDITIKSEQSISQCLICFDKSPDSVFQNCGHGGVCYDCAIEIFKKSGECYLCRKTILKVLQLDLTSKQGKTFRIIEGAEIEPDIIE